MTKTLNETIPNDEVQDLNYQFIVALVIVFISIVIFYIYLRKKQIRRGVILVGLSDTGKTLIFSQLLHSKNIATHTSIKENTENYQLNNKNLQIIDIPGHERLRDKYFDQYKPSAKAIVYVIDSSTIQQKIRDVAEYLYNILSDPIVTSITPKVLILCNKQDEISAKGCTVIKSLLERELNMLRITKSSQLDSVSTTKDKKNYLGKEDKEFEFTHIPQFHIEFAESQALCSHPDDMVDLDPLKKWLTKIA